MLPEPGSGKQWGRGSRWSEAELSRMQENSHLTETGLLGLFPGRSLSSVRQARVRARARGAGADEPAVKEPGDYVETLSPYLVDEFDCMEVWLRWNGYTSFRELCRDPLRGWVTLICTAK